MPLGGYIMFDAFQVLSEGKIERRENNLTELA